MKYNITVKTGSSKAPLVEKNTETNEYTVFVHQRPHNGEANAAIIEIFSKYLQVPKSSLTIIKGLKSKQKTIESK